jgi:voltage-gated potassium channel Kch
MGVRSMFLFEFKDGFRFNESEQVVCIGERALVIRTLSEGELAKLFGGWIIYGDPSGLDYLGVWGARKARTFRRILQERGVDVSLSRTRPGAIRMSVRHCQFVDRPVV